jgi:hypothetical protein
MGDAGGLGVSEAVVAVRQASMGDVAARGGDESFEVVRLRAQDVEIAREQQDRREPSQVAIQQSLTAVERVMAWTAPWCIDWFLLSLC